MTNLQHQQSLLLLMNNCAFSCSSPTFPEFLHPVAPEVSAAPEASAVPADLETGMACQQDTCQNHGRPCIQTPATLLLSRCVHMVFGSPNFSAGLLGTACHVWLLPHTGCIAKICLAISASCNSGCAYLEPGNNVEKLIGGKLQLARLSPVAGTALANSRLIAVQAELQLDTWPPSHHVFGCCSSSSSAISKQH